MTESTFFVELLQLALGTRNRLSRALSVGEWTAIYNECERQAIVGVLITGLERLDNLQLPPKELVIKWIGMSEMIRRQNTLVYRRCVDLAKRVKDDGYKYCILKGQGNAIMYPNIYSRSSGDIDVWLGGGKRKVVQYVHVLFPSINVEYHHMLFPIFDDVEVEVHYYPSFCYNKIYNRRLQRYFLETSEEQFNHFIKWVGTSETICVPTTAFNLVFQLSHMMRHFFTQGIGLRHAIDFFYLLNQDIDDREKKETLFILKKCGMYKFLCAIMWIEKEVLGLQKNLDIAPVRERAGRMVLQEMMKGGNFGKGYSHNQGRLLQVYASQMIYRLKFIKEFPSEPLWRPFTLVWDYVKKRMIGIRL